ncbi:MAG: hypothetical protein QW643_01385 [Thermoplasmata archaeon]
MKILSSIIAFITYGIVPSAIIYFIKQDFLFLNLKYDIIVFLVLATFISVFLFLLNNFKVKKLKYISLFLFFAISIIYIFYWIINGSVTLNVEFIKITVDYSLIAALFLIPTFLKFFLFISRNKGSELSMDMYGIHT